MDNVHPHASKGKLNSETTFIYALVDPNTQQIRYVGKSNDPQVRLYRHFREKGNTYKVKWLQSLKEKGQTPEILILEEVHVSQWQERESYWISFYRAQGLDLANGTDGGDGIHGMKHTPEARAKISEAGKGNQYSKGRKHPPEEIARRAASMKGHEVSEETREKISASKRGKPRSPETIAKMSASLTGRKQSAEMIEKKRGRKVSEETKMKMSLAAKGRIVSEETKAKLRNRSMSSETRAKVSEANKGRIVSDEERAMRRTRALESGHTPPSRKGAKLSEEQKLRLSEINKGRKMPDAHKQKLIEINKGNKYAQGHQNSLGLKHTEEFKEARRNYQHTPEAKEKIRLAGISRTKDPAKMALAEQVRADHASGMNYSQIAEKHNLDKGLIGRIVRRESWT